MQGVCGEMDTTCRAVSGRRRDVCVSEAHRYDMLIMFAGNVVEFAHWFQCTCSPRGVVCCLLVMLPCEYGYDGSLHEHLVAVMEERREARERAREGWTER